MHEWDGIRARIAGGCTNSGPRDWLEGVLDEHDHEIARLRRALKTIASGMAGDLVLSEMELSGIASAALTPVGYAIESEREPGSVQIYPETALEEVR